MTVWTPAGASRAGLPPVLAVILALALALVLIPSRSVVFGEEASLAEDPPTSLGSQTLARVAQAFSSLETFRAEFDQTQEWLGMEEEATFKGTLYLMRPNKFRIEYSEPEGHLQVSDGTQVWTYVPENEQVLLTRLDPDQQGGDILRRILEESTARPEVEQVELERGSARVLTLIPPSGFELLEVRLWIEAEADRILRYEMLESSGNRTTYRLTKTRENPKLEATLFHFEPPQGIPVVEVGAP